MEQLNLFDLGMENQYTEKTSEKIIKAPEMKVIKMESYAYTCSLWYYEERNYWHVITATIALLENNRVYLKEFTTYPFLYIFENEQKAYKFYVEKLNELRNHGKGSREIQVKLNIHNELEDMYYCEKNRYGCFEYWNNNFGDNTVRKRIERGLVEERH